MKNEPYYPTLLWLKNSFDATNQRGSAAYYSRFRHPLTGWSDSYPETTGYIIETLLDYYDFTSEKWLFEYAKNATDWIVSLQYPSGALPGLLGEKGSPSVFNTGMMLFGLVAMYEKTNNEQYFFAMKKAVDWLTSILDKNGKWENFSYVENHTPTYYTRVVWAVLKANQFLKNQETEKLMQKSLDFYKAKQNINGSLKDWSFSPNEPAFTHTIAYTQRGFLESGILLNDQESIEIAVKIANSIDELFEKNAKIAGTYDEEWRGNYNFTCLTGNCQLSLNASRIFEYNHVNKYHILAKSIFKTVENRPSSLPFLGYKGAIAGSQPLWGDYRKFCYPNWAAKFWLDAYLKIRKMQDSSILR